MCGCMCVEGWGRDTQQRERDPGGQYLPWNYAYSPEGGCLQPLRAGAEGEEEEEGETRSKGCDSVFSIPTSCRFSCAFPYQLRASNPIYNRAIFVYIYIYIYMKFG